MLHHKPRWQEAGTVLLVAAVAAMSLGLGALAAELAGDAGPGAMLPLAEPSPNEGGEGTALHEATRSGPRGQVRSARDEHALTIIRLIPGALLTHQQRQTCATPYLMAHVGTATQPPWNEADPQISLAHMTAIQHRRGLPLPSDVGRLQSLIVTATPTARPCFSRRYWSSHSAHLADE